QLIPAVLGQVGEVLGIGGEVLEVVHGQLLGPVPGQAHLLDRGLPLGEGEIGQMHRRLPPAGGAHLELAGGQGDLLPRHRLAGEVGLVRQGDGSGGPGGAGRLLGGVHGSSTSSMMYVVGAASRIESIRSSTPPWPGSRCPMSLMPRSRLSRDCERSPPVETSTSTAPIRAPAHQGRSSARVPTAVTPAVPRSREPANPSQLFFGLIRGAIGCFPNSTPAM